MNHLIPGLLSAITPESNREQQGPPTLINDTAAPPKAQQSLLLSNYKELTLRIFHTVNFVKNLGEIPAIEEENKINFRFKKRGYDKLIIFDLDETLIHSIREDGEELTNNLVSIQAVSIHDPEIDENFLNEFYIRPHLKTCLEEVNKKYEVAVFTVSEQYYADPIIDIIDPDGTLIQHRYFRHHSVQI